MIPHNASRKDRAGIVCLPGSGGCAEQLADHHAGKGCNPSGTVEIVHTFCAIYERICTRQEEGLVVHMHFNYDDENVRITSHRGERATLTIKPLIHNNLHICVPGWIPPTSVELAINGKRVSPTMIGSYAYLGKEHIGAGTTITLRYDLPARRTPETMPAGDTFEFSWRGDGISGVYPNDKPMPFYPILILNPPSESSMMTD